MFKTRMESISSESGPIRSDAFSRSIRSLPELCRDKKLMFHTIYLSAHVRCSSLLLDWIPVFGYFFLTSFMEWVLVILMWNDQLEKVITLLGDYCCNLVLGGIFDIHILSRLEISGNMEQSWLLFDILHTFGYIRIPFFEWPMLYYGAFLPFCPVDLRFDDWSWSDPLSEKLFAF